MPGRLSRSGLGLLALGSQAEVHAGPAWRVEAHHHRITGVNRIREHQGPRRRAPGHGHLRDADLPDLGLRTRGLHHLDP